MLDPVQEKIISEGVDDCLPQAEVNKRLVAAGFPALGITQEVMDGHIRRMRQTMEDAKAGFIRRGQPVPQDVLNSLRNMDARDKRRAANRDEEEAGVIIAAAVEHGHIDPVETYNELIGMNLNVSESFVKRCVAREVGATKAHARKIETA